MSPPWSRAFFLTLLLTLFLTGVVLADEAVHWSYEGEEGPEHWGEISPQYALCATGKEQSPIDIPGSAPLNTNNLVFRTEPAPLTILNNGHTIQVAHEEGSSIELDGTAYSLKQFHFHGPSEHTIDGKHFAMEMHLVHQNADGGLAVVGVLIEEGAEHPAFAPLMSHLPTQPTDPKTISNVTVDTAALLPANREYYRYNGSLTTPPCTEGVKWLVLSEPIELSKAQIEAFVTIMHENERPIQRFNARQFLQGAQATTPPAALPASGAERSYSLAGLLLMLGTLYLVLGLAIAVGRRQKA